MAGSKEKWARMAGVAKSETAAGCEKSRDDCRGEVALWESEVNCSLSRRTNSFLIETIHKAAH